MAITDTRRRRPVRLVRLVPAPLEAVVAILRGDPPRAIGSHLGAPRAASDVTADLGVELPGGRHLARQVRVRCGLLLEDDDALALPLWWEAAEHPQLFPAFDGALELRGDGGATELRLVGSYEPPLGFVGRFADGLVGHRLVMASLGDFLDDVAARLAAAVTADT